MKQIVIIQSLVFSFVSLMCFGQTFEKLEKFQANNLNVYYSKGSGKSAGNIAEKVLNAEKYFSEAFSTKPGYTLLILNPEDWKTFAHPQAIYGIPHYLPDGRLVVAAENNEFWKKNTPPLDLLPTEIAAQFRKIYQDEKGEVSVQNFFDLLAIHELGHAFQKAAGVKSQRNWMNELMCNILLHTYVAENEPESLPALTMLPNVYIQSVDASTLTFTTLKDFEDHYGEIAQKNPVNYGWYQFRLHSTAGKIYDSGGENSMKKIWNSFLKVNESLDDNAFQQLLESTDKNLGKIVSDWGKN